MKSSNGRSIQSLDRAFDILHVIGQSDAKGLSLKEICGVTKLHPSTTHHLLSTMVARGYVSQNSDSRRRLACDCGGRLVRRGIGSNYKASPTRLHASCSTAAARACMSAYYKDGISPR